MTKPFTLALLIVSTCILGLCSFVIYTARHPDLFINDSGSAPRGLWTMYDENRAPRLGDWVVVCPPFDEELYRQLYQEEPPTDDNPCVSSLMLKQIAAVPGDRVNVTGQVITTPLSTVRAMEVRRSSVSLPTLPRGPAVVPQNHFWVINPNHALSFDSRYFGPVDAGAIQRFARPIFTENFDG